MTPLNASYHEVAERYFEFLSNTFPVMCASDEFYFFPRAQSAAANYHNLDQLDEETIYNTVYTLKDYQDNFNNLAENENDLESLIDLELLEANVSGILIAFEQNQIWRHDPLIYLKIAFIGIDHAISKPATTEEFRLERAFSRIDAVPELLNQAVHNLEFIPVTYYQAGFSMLDDCLRCLEQVYCLVPVEFKRHFVDELERARDALFAFRNYLSSVSPIPDEQFVTNSLESTLRDHFLVQQDSEEIYQIGVDLWNTNLDQLKKLQKKIDPSKSWQEIYHSVIPDEDIELDTLSLYGEEIEKLRTFFYENDFTKDDLLSPVEVIETPIYLKSIRGTASFSAAFTKDKREKSFFYITTQLSNNKDTDEQRRLIRRLHREYKFLTAHETVPGHHFLDSNRRVLNNPVRSQIESPLFYEGWASYAETLLSEYGYIEAPVDRLIDYKRRLWRSARCRIDIGLSEGFMKKEEAQELLVQSGFSKAEATRQINRFHLNPGYQLCYSLGSHEISGLKEMFEPQLGIETFYRILLEGGELPFHLVKKRFEAHIANEEEKRKRIGQGQDILC